MAEGLKEKTAKGLLWGGIGNGAMQLLNLLFGIILSRLLSPTDYGMVGALTIFSAMAGIFTESGFILAVVNKKNVDHHDYNALFWFNLIMGASLYGLLYLCAPLIADFYHTPEMVPLGRYLFLSFFIGGTAVAPTAYLFRNMMVKQRSIALIVAILVSGGAGVACAFNGMAYWGIATQTVLYSTTNALMVWIIAPWRPSFNINLKPLRELLPFASKQVITSLFTHINNNVFAVVLGYFFTIRQVGYYTQGNKWTTMGYSTVNGMINGVAQPVLRRAYEENNPERLRQVFRKMLRFTVFVCFPALFGLAIIAREVIEITITSKWLPCVPVMQVLCIWGAFVPVTTLYANLMNGIGRPAIYMYNTIALGITQLAVIALTYTHGIIVMLSVYAAINILWLGIWQYFAHKHTGLQLSHVLRDITPYLIISGAIMVGVDFHVTRFAGNNLWLSLTLKIVSAAGIYIFIMWALDSKIFRETLHYFRHKSLD